MALEVQRRLWVNAPDDGPLAADHNSQRSSRSTCTFSSKAQLPLRRSVALGPSIQSSAVLGPAISDQPAPDVASFASLLRQFAKEHSLPDGQRLHSHLISCGYDQNLLIGNSLVQMYGSCGCLDDARAVFDRLRNPNSFSWNILIRAYAQNGSLEDAQSAFDRATSRDVVSWSTLIGAYAQHKQTEEALMLYHCMQLDGITPSVVSFISVLDACAGQGALAVGRDIHALIVELGYQQELVLGTALISMYSMCLSLDDVENAFNVLIEHDVIAWNALCSAWVKNGHYEDALLLFDHMQHEGVQPNSITFTCVAHACANLSELESGHIIHHIVIDSGCEQDVILGTALIDMYGKCMRVTDAKSTFDGMRQRNVICWSAIIAAYAFNNHMAEAVDLFGQMQVQGSKPNKVTFVSLLDACASEAVLEQGQYVHVSILEFGYEQDEVISTALLHMYSKCGDLENASNVFAKSACKDAVLWNTIIAAYAQNGDSKQALELYNQMRQTDVKPSQVTFVSVLDACTCLTGVEEGREMWQKAGQEVHIAIVDNGFEGDTTVGNALVNMYRKQGDLDLAKTMFRRMPQWDVVSWSTIIAACGENDHNLEALELFDSMHIHGFNPEKVTFICTLDACGSLSALQEGYNIHTAIVSSKVEDDLVLGTSLIYMYGKCGSLDDAKHIFYRLSECDRVAWNAMISACIENEHGREALRLFSGMQQQGIQPNEVTFIHALDACASLADLETGQAVHSIIVGNGYEMAIMVANALINMYGRCASLLDAKSLLQRLTCRNVVTWNAMITACSQGGCGNEALKVYHDMQLDRVKPNHITFVSTLTACSHTGQVDDGKCCFISMLVDFGIAYSGEHYVCLIDLLGRAGRLEEAQELLSMLPLTMDNVAHLTFLGGCKIHGDMEHGILAANHCFELDLDNDSAYVMLSNIYATVDVENG